MLLKDDMVEAYKLFMAAALTGSVKLLNQRNEEDDGFIHTEESLVEDANEIAAKALLWLEGYEEGYEDMRHNQRILEKLAEEKREARLKEKQKDA